MNYQINKGVGRSFEFKGLRTVYVFIALGGLIGSIILYFVLGLFLPFTITMILVVVCVLISVGGSYYLNFKYKEHGLAFTRTQRATWQHIQMNGRLRRFLTN